MAIHCRIQGIAGKTSKMKIFVILIASMGIPLFGQSLHHISESFDFYLNIDNDRVECFGGVFELDSSIYEDRDNEYWNYYDMANYKGLSGIVSKGENVYIADNFHHNIKRVNLESKQITSTSRIIEDTNVGIVELLRLDERIIAITDDRVLYIYTLELELLQILETESIISTNSPILYEANGFVFLNDIPSSECFKLLCENGIFKIESLLFRADTIPQELKRDPRVISYSNGVGYKRNSICPGVYLKDDFYFLNERLPTLAYDERRLDGKNVYLESTRIIYYQVTNEQIKITFLNYK